MPTATNPTVSANWLSCRRAALRAGLAQRHIRELILKKQLPALRTRGRYLISVSALDNMLAGVGAQPLELPPETEGGRE